MFREVQEECLFRGLLEPEDEGSTFFQNVGIYLPVDMAYNHRRLEWSSEPLREPQILHASSDIRVILGVWMDGRKKKI
jgi:hypothetical protein